MVLSLKEHQSHKGNIKSVQSDSQIVFNAQKRAYYSGDVMTGKPYNTNPSGIMNVEERMSSVVAGGELKLRRKSEKKLEEHAKSYGNE